MLSYGITYALVVLLSFTLIELLARRWRALNDNIEALQNTRNELVENEKMASLGRFMAGFAHELNTPVGIAVAKHVGSLYTYNESGCFWSASLMYRLQSVSVHISVA